LIFLGWYLASFLIWNSAVFALRNRGVLGPAAATFGMFLWWAAMAGSAFVVALLWERRVEERHQREIIAASLCV
jgi:hypothetical protein